MNSSEHVARLLTLAFAMALVSTCSIGGMSAAQAERWNLIAIVTDDQAEWEVRSYGNDEIVTPNMDRLAREGARFTSAFAASGVCTPSRVAHLTGHTLPSREILRGLSQCGRTLRGPNSSPHGSGSQCARKRT